MFAEVENHAKSYLFAIDSTSIASDPVILQLHSFSGPTGQFFTNYHSFPVFLNQKCQWSRPCGDPCVNKCSLAPDTGKTSMSIALVCLPSPRWGKTLIGALFELLQSNLATLFSQRNWIAEKSSRFLTEGTDTNRYVTHAVAKYPEHYTAFWGPFIEGPEKCFCTQKAEAKFQSFWSQSCFIHTFLMWTEVPFMQGVLGAHASRFLNTDYLKMALWTRKGPRAFEKRASGVR